MEYLSGHALTLANSIIGVSILAMPYCFKQCGIILSIIILMISSIISRLACHFLLKSAIMARRKTFEILAFHIFGSLGKFSIEIGMIGFLLGTCVAFFVVMGDLAPDIVSEITGAKTGYTLRNGILVALAIFCVLPLGLLKNVDSLNGVSKATIAFYCALALKTIVEAMPHIFTGDWVKEVVLWRPGGILQCLPIFSMALFCQSQIFEIYQALPNASLEKMNSLIRVAVNMCTGVYIFVGTFGYIAFFKQPFTGNVLLSFKPSIMSDIMKIGFILSLAFSFPIVIFPCRASLYSLLYKEPHYSILHEGVTTNYIPELKFKLLTLFIVTVSLIIGIAIPNIELVLGLVGSTIGVIISVLFPVTCFICISPKNTNERILAQIMLCIGIVVMVLGTYANLYAFETTQLRISTEKPIMEKSLPDIRQEKINKMVEDILEEKKIEEKIKASPIIETINQSIKVKEKQIVEPQVADIPENLEEIRKEQPQQIEESLQVDKTNKEEGKSSVVLKKIPSDEVKAAIDDDWKDKQKQELENLAKEQQQGEEKLKKIKLEQVSTEASVKKMAKNATNESDSIKKQLEDAKKKEVENKILIDSLQKQNEIQKELVEQNKMLIQVIQNQQEKVKAVKEIENIALKAIESLSGGSDKKVEENKKVAPDIVVTTTVKTQIVEKVEPLQNQSIKTIEAKPSAEVNKNELIMSLGGPAEKNSSVSKIPLIPLPLVLANSQLKSNKTEKSAEKKTVDLEMNVLRRDILSEMHFERSKREISSNAELKKDNSIEVLCKLPKSDLKNEESKCTEGVDVKIPQQRDLKAIDEN